MNHARALRGFITAKDSSEAVEAALRPFVEEALEREAQAFGKRDGLVYRGPADFVLQHGKWFHKIAVIPPKQRAPYGYCFGTAINACATVGENYYEGFAVFVQPSNLPTKTIAVGLHAWNTQKEHPDVVIDRTWTDPAGLLYVGVEFSVERADDATWNGDGSVLMDDKRGFPLLQQRWNGEPEGLVWPASERLDMMRTHDTKAALIWLNKNRKELGL